MIQAAFPKSKLLADLGTRAQVPLPFPGPEPELHSSSAWA